MAHWIGAAIFIASIGFANADQAQRNQIPGCDVGDNVWLLIECVKGLKQLEEFLKSFPEEIQKACSGKKTNYVELKHCIDAHTKN
jgi:hypothetical protein